MSDRMIYNLQPMLQARDLAETHRFYTEVLGFRQDGRWPEDGEPRWYGLTSGNARIMLVAMQDAAAEPQFTGTLYLYPDDIDAAWTRLRDAAPVEQPLMTTEYGMREFIVRDPNGYRLSFGMSSDHGHDHDHPHDDDGHAH
jgi:uncharacterized glyoxalase superfamily protein PhnB